MAATRKVAIQLISTGGYYGAERALIELAAYLHDHGWDSRVIALEGAGAAELVRRAAERGLTAEAFVGDGRLGVIPMLTRLRHLLRQHPGAVLHSHGYKPDILLAFTGVTRHFPALATCHNWISESAKMRALEALDKRALRRFAHVAAVSSAIAAQLLRSGIEAGCVSVIDNGISVLSPAPQARERIRAEFAVGAGERLVLHLGRLARSKRIDVLLAALAELAPQLSLKLLLVGEGEEREALERLAGHLNLESRVHFCGYRRDVPDLLAAAELFALSSEREGLPISLLEAMAAACPIVATRVGAIPEVLQDGRDAWLVPAGDLAALRRALGEALASPADAHQRARSAEARFSACYSRDAMGARYLPLYEGALRN
jgi:glycosyltransferase involved in cell wall biosynthesis